MNIQPFMDELEKNGEAFRALLSGLPAEMVKWRPAPEKWSFLEIVCHLYDEELDDFRVRIVHLLEAPETPMPRTDPPGWVTSRNYAGQNYQEKLTAFLQERKNTVKWLLTLKDANWESAHIHPRVGPIPAKKLLITWPAHDYLHLRQIIRYKFEYSKAVTGDNLDYAGAW